MTQAVSCCSLTVEAWVHTQVGSRGICDGQSGIDTSLSLDFACQYHSTMVLRIRILSGGLTVGLLVAAVQRCSLTPLT
jgi:hypothetical protein